MVLALSAAPRAALSKSCRYKPRKAFHSPLWRLTVDHLDSFVSTYDSRYRELYGSLNFEVEKALREEEKQFRAEVTAANSLFNVDPAKDKDPDPKRYFDGRLAVDSSVDGLEVAKLVEPGFRKEVRREQGQVSFIKIRKDVKSQVHDAVLRVSDTEATIQTRYYEKKGDEGWEKFVTGVEFVAGTVAATGLIGMGAAVAFGLI